LLATAHLLDTSMIRSTFLRSAAVLTLLVSSFSSAEAQGRVFVNNDEWTLDQSGT